MAFSTNPTPSCFLFSSHKLRVRLSTSDLPAIFTPSFQARYSIGTGTISLPTVAGDSQLRQRALRAAMASGTTPLSTETKKGESRVLVFENEEELSESLANFTADLSEKFCRERGAFTVVISGGSLVKSLRKLAESPYADTIDWGKWHVFFVDERVVPKDHPDSNYKLAYDLFLSKVDIPAGHVYASNESLSAEGAADDYEMRLKHLVNTGVIQLSRETGFPRFDLMLLGMGPDGHIASLFPGHPLLKEEKRWVSFTTTSPKPPPERISLTLPVINTSAFVALVVTGAGKSDAVYQALGSENGSSPLLPVQMVKLHDGYGAVTWFTDKAASSKLQSKSDL